MTARVILLLAIGLTSAAGAEIMCPFMNAATAGGILRGQVDSTVTTSGPHQTCEFTLRNSTDKLRIEVTTMDASRTELAAFTAPCTRPAEPLRGIGNDAAACSIDSHTEQVAGRVRKQAFAIRIHGTSSSDNLRKKAIGAAEQVAGSLF